MVTEVGSVTSVPSPFRITNEYCPFDCRLFTQEHDVVKDFDRTTGSFELYTDDESFIGTFFDYAIRCESVFSSSGVQTSGVIEFESESQSVQSTKTATRHGND